MRLCQVRQTVRESKMKRVVLSSAYVVSRGKARRMSSRSSGMAKRRVATFGGLVGVIAGIVERRGAMDGIDLLPTNFCSARISTKSSTFSRGVGQHTISISKAPNRAPESLSNHAFWSSSTDHGFASDACRPFVTTSITSTKTRPDDFSNAACAQLTSFANALSMRLGTLELKCLSSQ